MPLPGEPQAGTVEFIRTRQRAEGRGRPHVRLLPVKHRLPDSVSVRVATDHGPFILPCHRLEVRDSAVRTPVLKVDEPGFSGGGLNPPSLVWAVDGGLPLCEDNPVLVRPEHTARSERHLPSHPDTTRRGKDVIETVPFVELRAL